MEQAISITHDSIERECPETKSYAQTRIHGSFGQPTLRQFVAFQNCYQYFNEKLFGGKLPAVILTLNESSRSDGYYNPSAWHEAPDGSVLAEIAVSPLTLLAPFKEKLCPILVHQQVHHFQHTYGTPGTLRYHNQEFARLMAERGLICSDTGRPDGLQTGYKMRQYVQDGGPFAQALRHMPPECVMPFAPNIVLNEPVGGVRNSGNLIVAERSKTKFVCPHCRQAAWGKPSLNIICGNCHTRMHISSSVKINSV